ncbi:MAG: SHOCT domain-containing protein [Phycisphaerales bacterium]|nr:SHOCT domain-containing protein [Phycisphaerales bacterium]
MEVIPYAVIGFIVLIVLVGIAVGAHRKEAAEETRDRLNQFAGFNCSDLYVSDHDASGIAVDAANKRLLVSGKSTPERVYDASQIMGVEIVKNGETVHTTNRGSQAVGVAVGAVLLGPLGAVIGGLSGSRQSRGLINRITLRVLLDDFERPRHEVVFFDLGEMKGWKETSPLLKPVLDRVLDWHGRIEQLMRAASITTPEAQSSSVADEIGKLHQLMSAGAITAEEFNHQKQRLLGTFPKS